MEVFNKANPEEYKCLDPNNYTISVNGREKQSFFFFIFFFGKLVLFNFFFLFFLRLCHLIKELSYVNDSWKTTISSGRKPLTIAEKGKLGGGYNVLLQTELPENFRVYDPAKETTESALKVFKTTFPRGFALEILHVYSGPPVIVYKFRHWGFMEGPFKGHSPTGELVEFFGMAIFEVDEQSNKIVKVQFFYDPKQLLEGLVKGDKIGDELKATASSTCPFMAASK
ncbi:OLC1v1016628C1 [Oldenlandia corymbosa var. corymbosa]|nr:OLC1v1016628C1 [Oldenlandia corymbosa var. corymbosa]